MLFISLRLLEKCFGVMQLEPTNQQEQQGSPDQLEAISKPEGRQDRKRCECGRKKKNRM